MSKVVHLSDDAHQRAKDFCKENRLKMSDWVAVLIDDAIARGHKETERAPVNRKKPLQRVEERPAPPPEPVQEGVPAYAMPPFWARNRQA